MASYIKFDCDYDYIKLSYKTPIYAFLDRKFPLLV